MGNLLKEFLELLKGIEAFKFVTVWNNQFTYMEDGSSYTFPMPCAFVEINNENPQQLSGGHQGSDLSITVHIGQDMINGVNMDENLSIFDLRDAVIRALANFKPTTAGAITVTSERQDFDHANIYHYEITFTTHWIDSTGAPDQRFINPVTLQINK